MKVLIVRLGALGDIVHTIPAQQALKAAFPTGQVHWLVEDHYGSFLRRVPGIDRLWIMTSRHRKFPQLMSGLPPLIRDLRREKFDLLFDFQGLLKSAVLGACTKAERRLGFSARLCRERAAAWFYTEPTDLDETGRHRLQLNCDLVRQVISVPPENGHIPLKIPSEAVSYVVESLRANSVSQAPVLLNPGAGWDTKIWSPRKFGKLADFIQNKLKIPVVITYGPGEEDLVRRVLKAASSSPVTFPTTLLQLAALLRRSRLMVAGDTGPLHLAVSLGTPTVALMGPTWAWRNGPFHPRDRTVQTGSPCPRPYSRRCRAHTCMDIPVARVCVAVRQRLASQPHGMDY